MTGVKRTDDFGKDLHLRVQKVEKIRLLVSVIHLLPGLGLQFAYTYFKTSHTCLSHSLILIPLSSFFVPDFPKPSMQTKFPFLHIFKEQNQNS